MRHALAVKSETDSTLVLEGWGVIFSGETDPDLTGDYFTKSTDFWLDRLGGAARPVLYNHGFDAELKRSVIGTGSLEAKAVEDGTEGLWFTAQLDKSNAYVKQIRALAEAGLLGTSTGAISHLVEREAKGDANFIKSWPIGEVSLTVTPCEPRTIGIAEVRTLVEDIQSKAAVKDTLSSVERDRLHGSSFAYVDKDGVGHLPIENEAHVKDAIARFDQEQFPDSATKKRAARKIRAAAKREGITLGPDDAVSKAAKSLKALSFEDLQAQIRVAVNRAGYGLDDGSGYDADYSCIVATYPDSVVVDRQDYDQDGDGGLWRFSYAIDPATNQVTLGEPERVETTYSPITKSLVAHADALKALLPEVKATEPQPADAATKAAEPFSTEETEMSQEILDAIKALSEQVNGRIDGIDEAVKAVSATEEAVKSGGVAIPAVITKPTADSDAEAEFKSFLRGLPFKAAMNEGTNSQGGYAVPALYSNDLVRPLTDLSYLRLAGARIIDVAGTDAFHVPSLSYASAASLTSEAASYSESEPTMGEVQFTPYKATRLSKVSEELAADSRFDLWGQILMPDFAQSFAAFENSYFTTGTGSSQPQGVVVGASANDVTFATGNTTSIPADSVIDIYFALPYFYRANAVWMMNDATLKVVRKLKDSQNRYLFEPNPFVAPGAAIGAAQSPNGITTSGTLLGKPVITNNQMATPSANAKTILFGDFSYYWIGQWAGLEMQRLSELYAANGQVGFRAFRRLDGHVMLSAAFSRGIQSAT